MRDYRQNYKPEAVRDALVYAAVLVVCMVSIGVMFALRA